MVVSGGREGCHLAGAEEASSRNSGAGLPLRFWLWAASSPTFASCWDPPPPSSLTSASATVSEGFSRLEGGGGGWRGGGWWTAGGGGEEE